MNNSKTENEKTSKMNRMEENGKRKKKKKIIKLRKIIMSLGLINKINTNILNRLLYFI